MPSKRLPWCKTCIFTLLHISDLGMKSYASKVVTSLCSHLWLSCNRFYSTFWQIELTLYNPKDSVTGEFVSCNSKFCKEIGGGLSGCNANTSCMYTELYGDGSYTMGYYIEDIFQYERVSGDLETKSANGSVIFGYVQNPNCYHLSVVK